MMLDHLMMKGRRNKLRKGDDPRVIYQGVG